jgi:glycosyltransferase involved in cell wall biosynthesis
MRDAAGSPSGASPGDPVFSVVVATYQRGALIAPTLESIARQAFSDFEVLIVSDGPAAPGLAEAVAGFDSRFRLTATPVRAGSQSGPNNLGWSMARGRCVAYLGHDDIWHADHLLRLAATFDATPTASFAVSGCVYFGPSGTGDELTWVTGMFDADDATAPATHFFPPSSVAHLRTLPAGVPPWPDAELISRPVDGEFMIAAFHHGCRFAPTGAITVFKLASALRYLSYLSPDDTEQRELLALLDDPVALEARVRGAVDSARRSGSFMATRHAESDALDRGQVLRQNARIRGTEATTVCRLAGVEWIPVADEWLGFDWHPVELDRGRRVRWSGPNHRPRLAIPFFADGPVRVRVKVAGFANEAIRSSLRVFVNGEPVESMLLPDVDGEAVAFSTALRADRPSVLEFRTGPAVLVSDLFPGSADTRRVGFALIGVELTGPPLGSLVP